jgi:hypothetical protein
MSYLDFEIEIGTGSGRDYPVAVIRSTAGEAHETMHFPFDELALENRLKDLQIALLRSGGKRRQIHNPEEQTVRKFGQALFNALFKGEVYSRYVVSQREADQQGKGLRLKLRIQSSELAALPWEFLFDADQAEYVCLSNKTPIVRYLELPQPPQPLVVMPPLRILGMVVNPTELGTLDVENEKLRLEKAIENLQANGFVELTWLQGQTWQVLQRAMRHGPWHIFHFIGHGGFDLHSDEGLIALKDSADKVRYLSASQLGRLLSDHRPLRLVVLNSCEGARSSEHDIFSSTAAILVRRGIPAVLAMQYEITDRAAIELSRAFYEALADGMPVDAAVSEARKAISLGVENTVEWGTPVLYMRSPDGDLFDIVHKPNISNTVSTRPLSFFGEDENTTIFNDMSMQASAKDIEQINHLKQLENVIQAPSKESQSVKSVEIFYSYAHEDERLRKKLETHLSLLKQEGLITGWYDREIRAGAEWMHEIEAHLNSAHIILLLVSPDFMASDYCYSIEMKRALERHEARSVRVIPIILRPTDWKKAPFSKLQVLPSNQRPITKWPDRDEAFLNVAQDIRKAVDELNTKLAISSSSEHMVSSPDDKVISKRDENAGVNERWPIVHDQSIPQTTSQSAFLFNQPLTDPTQFYGRIRERETLINRTRNGASTSIVGPRRIGKTWLLSYLKLVARMELGARYLVGYLDAATARCATVTGFTASVLEVFSVQRPPFNGTYESLMVMEQVVQDFLSRNQIPVLCIDEFEGFGDQKAFDLHFFTTLRALAQTGLSLVVASKSPLIDIVGNNGKTSGFFNVFEQLIMKPFSFKEAESFVRLKGMQAGLTEEERNRLLQLGQQGSEYWPLRLQLIGKMLLEDKIIAVRENDSDYFRPNDPIYWQEFQGRLEETYRGVVR